MSDVLFVGGGRRVSLARLFKVRGLRVAAYELSPDVPLATEGLVVQGKSWDDDLVYDHIDSVVRKLGVKLVLPLDCRAVRVLADVSLRYVEGLSPYAVSPRTTASACLNKAEFAWRCPPEFYPHPVDYWPYCEKPAEGFGSHAVSFGSNHLAVTTTQGYVRQRRLKGDEYSVDAYFARDGRFVAACPRLRVWVAGGEVIESVTVDRPDLVNAVQAVASAFHFRGPTCFQFMEDASHPFCIEVNARFGGGAPLSIAAGLPMVDWLVREYVLGETLPASAFAAKPRAGVRTVRSYQDHFFG